MMIMNCFCKMVDQGTAESHIFRRNLPSGSLTIITQHAEEGVDPDVLICSATVQSTYL